MAMFQQLPIRYVLQEESKAAICRGCFRVVDDTPSDDSGNKEAMPSVGEQRLLKAR
jgi:hypothetical protein